MELKGIASNDEENTFRLHYMLAVLSLIWIDCSNLSSVLVQSEQSNVFLLLRLYSHYKCFFIAKKTCKNIFWINIYTKHNSFLCRLIVNLSQLRPTRFVLFETDSYWNYQWELCELVANVAASKGFYITSFTTPPRY